MSKQIYEKLLEDFRRAWCEHGELHFAVEIFAPSSFSTRDDPPYDPERYELLAEVALPLDADIAIAADGSNSTMFGWAAIQKGGCSAEVRASFLRLCREAGAALPVEFREQLCGLCPWHMPGPASWWLALLVRLSGASAYSHDGEYVGHVALMQPFLLCTLAIETCRLNTDDAALPGRDTEAPEAAHSGDVTASKRSKGKGEGLGCQEVAKRLEKLRLQGESYTSQHKLAKQIGCSVSTVNKAIQNTEALRAWADIKERTPAPKAVRLNDLVADNVPQSREPVPGESFTRGEAEEKLDELILEAVDIGAPRNQIKGLLEMRSLPEDDLIRAMKPYRDADDLGRFVLGHKP